MSELREGNIVFYQDYPTQGYPLCLCGEMLQRLSFEKIVRTNPDGFQVKTHPMQFRFPDFFKNNEHLLLKDEDIPAEIVYIHDFQNWYFDQNGHHAKILQGTRILNEPHLKTL